MSLKLYNSLHREKEVFTPLRSEGVGLYSCGPTVYDYPTIGNWRTYVMSDFLVRTLSYLGYSVTYIMNITDVGHLTGDNVGDADTGEDRLEKASKKENRSAWDIAQFYTDDFINHFEDLNLIKPLQYTKATDHIPEQIDLVKRIEQKGFAYKTSDGIYFDVKAYELAGNTYGELSTLDQVKEGARVEVNAEKKDPRDFALWKFSPKNEKRQMEWDSPWGVGFPGWHIECSAMSMKYLGEQFDIHVGGEDLKPTHHPNEIAQSEAATGQKPFVTYWLHGAHLQIDGGRMGKSLGNAYTLQDIASRGYDPLDLRYFYLTGHYRKKLNFTWEALTAAQTARHKLLDQVAAARQQTGRTVLSDEKNTKVQEFSMRFREAISDDLNMPQALAIIWEVLKSNIPSEDKYDLALSFDEVLGLGLGRDIVVEKGVKVEEVEKEVQDLIDKREQLRKAKKFDEADKVRDEIEKRGYTIKDTAEGVEVKKIQII